MPLRAATATATYRPIIVWDPLARMAAIMAMVATATAVTRMLVDRGAQVDSPAEEGRQTDADSQDQQRTVQQVRHEAEGHPLKARNDRGQDREGRGGGEAQRDCCEDLRPPRHPRTEPLDDSGDVRGAGRGERDCTGDRQPEQDKEQRLRDRERCRCLLDLGRSQPDHRLQGPQRGSQVSRYRAEPASSADGRLRCSFEASRVGGEDMMDLPGAGWRFRADGSEDARLARLPPETAIRAINIKGKLTA